MRPGFTAPSAARSARPGFGSTQITTCIQSLKHGGVAFALCLSACGTAKIRNRYSGTCRWCGRIVEPGKGNVMGAPGKWEFSHDACIPEYQRPKRKVSMEYDL